MHILFYISSHGYGHAGRQQETIRLLQAAGVHVHVRTAAPAKFFATAHALHVQHYDIGMIQHDPLRYEIDATLAWLEAFVAAEPALIAQEVAYARRHQVQFILSDMPPFACAVAAALGVPCAVLSHFTWDWVYAHYVARAPRFQRLIDHFTAQYAQATLALHMPFAHEFPLFTRVEPVGLFHNPLTKTRADLHQAFDIPTDHRVALLSMGGHGWGSTDVRALTQLKGWTFLVMPGAYAQVQGHPQCRVIPTDYAGYHNLIGTVDVVVGKAGGGTVAEVVAHRVRMLYTLPQDWRESGLLDAALHTQASAQKVAVADFERGAWVVLLEPLLARPLVTPIVALGGWARVVELVLNA